MKEKYSAPAFEQISIRLIDVLSSSIVENYSEYLDNNPDVDWGVGDDPFLVP